MVILVSIYFSIGKRLKSCFVARARLSNMPPEIIEHIARSPPICVPWYLVDDEIQFPLDKHSLIALSQTCWSVRVPTERQLYRDLYMNLGPMYGAIGRQVDRILNTLQRRPELGTYMKNFAMMWTPGYSLSSTVDNIISRFPTLFPRLQFLFLSESHYPQLLDSFSGCNITSFGTHFTDKESLCNILSKFPKLTYLYLDDFFPITPLDGIPHHLSRLKVRGRIHHPEIMLRHILQLCGGTVTQLYIENTGLPRFSDTEEDMETSLPKRLPETTYHITSLHLVLVDVLSGPRNGASLLQLLPLQYLCTECAPAPLPEGWNALPRTLRRLTMLNYDGYYDTPVFVEMLVKCLSSSIVNVASIQRMELWGCGQEELQNIPLLREFCQEKEMPCSIMNSEMDPRIHVYCK